MEKGPAKVPAVVGHEHHIIADGEFSVFGLGDGGSRECIFGPCSITDRQLVFKIPPGISSLEIRCKPSVLWHMNSVDRHAKEPVDPTPMEVSVGHRTETLTEQIKRMVRDELSRAADESGAETFEEADDFDVPDEDPEFISPYEMTEMQEEEPFDAEGLEGGDGDGDTAPDEVESGSDESRSGEADKGEDQTVVDGPSG